MSESDSTENNTNQLQVVLKSTSKEQSNELDVNKLNVPHIPMCKDLNPKNKPDRQNISKTDPYYELDCDEFSSDDPIDKQDNDIDQRDHLDISNDDFREDVDISDYDPTYEPDSKEIDILDDDITDKLDQQDNDPDQSNDIDMSTNDFGEDMDISDNDSTYKPDETDYNDTDSSICIYISNKDSGEDLDISDSDPTYKPDNDEIENLDDDLGNELDTADKYPLDKPDYNQDDDNSYDEIIPHTQTTTTQFTSTPKTKVRKEPTKTRLQPNDNTSTHTPSPSSTSSCTCTCTKAPSQVQSQVAVNNKRNNDDRACQSDETPSKAFVSTSTSTSTDRKWTKYVYCLYCGEKQTKIRRHCKRKHKDEMLVAQATAIESLNRLKADELWNEIKNKGNHKHNLEVHAGNKSDLVVKKRPVEGSTTQITDFVPCSDCLAYFSTKSLWRHKKTCPKRNQQKQGGRCLKEARNMIPTPYPISNQLSLALERLNHDTVALIVRNDRHILRVGQRALSQSNSKSTIDIAKEKMRVLGRLLVEAREKDPTIRTAADLPYPSKFDTLVEATLVLSGFNDKNQKHNHYSTAMRVGYALNDLASILRSELIKTGMDEGDRQVGRFIFVKKGEWREKITASALRQRQANAWKKPKVLPLNQDIQEFNAYLKAKVQEVAPDGAITTSTQYRDLAQLTLASIILFNRRRPHEVESLTIDDYEQSSHGAYDDLHAQLSTAEKLAISRLKVVMVRGKRGRGVPILLTPEMDGHVQLLAHFNKRRNKPHVFARQRDDAETPYRASAVVGDLANKANLKMPENMRCTKLRKHLATMTQLINLQEEELEQLATHMGHNIRTHREYYRLPHETILLTKVSKLLHMAEKGTFASNAGRKLSDIHVGEKDEVDVEVDEEEDEDDVEMNDNSDASSSASDVSSHAERSPTSEEGPSCGRNPIFRRKPQSKRPSEIVPPTQGDPATRRKPSTHKNPLTQSNPSTQRNPQRKNSPSQVMFQPGSQDAQEGGTSHNGRKYVRWSHEEEAYLCHNASAKALLSQWKVPGKVWCENFIAESRGVLHNKSWKDIKNKMHNIQTTEKARLKRREKQCK